LCFLPEFSTDIFSMDIALTASFSQKAHYWQARLKVRSAAKAHHATPCEKPLSWAVLRHAN